MRRRASRTATTTRGAAEPPSELSPASLDGPPPSRACLVCFEELDATATVVTCSGAAEHAMCQPCFSEYAEQELAHDAALVRERGARLLCSARLPGLGGCQGGFTDRTLARALSEAQYEKYMTQAREQIRAEEMERANEVVRDGRGDARELLARELRVALPGAKMCAACGFGPVVLGGCSDLALHHGERVTRHRRGPRVRGPMDMGVVDNSCPHCGWYARSSREWHQWDGRVHNDVVL